MTQPPDFFQILLIDGNNLAHFLYPDIAPGQKMAPADSVRLIRHLNNYARQYQQSLQVELCLDRSPGEYGVIQDNLRVLCAAYPQNGDDLLTGRFWYHHFAHRPCLVITNDSAILEEVAQAGGASLRVFDFVRRPGITSPVFREPEELPRPPAPSLHDDESNHKLSLKTSVYFRIVEDPRIHMDRPASRPRSDFALQPSSQTAELNEQATQTEPLPDKVESLAAVEAPGDVRVKEPASGIRAASEGLTGSEPFYFLDLDRWPLVDGIRFLTQAFCPSHRAEYRDLLDLIDPDHLDPGDMRALAELLLYTCAEEENFARRGSLMTRVRLALLQAGGEPVSLSDLALAAGLKKPGLQGRIKAKAGRWVVII